jgi:pimeloyl-ACP methyl ester carboxylesterase
MNDEERWKFPAYRYVTRDNILCDSISMVRASRESRTAELLVLAYFTFLFWNVTMTSALQQTPSQNRQELSNSRSNTVGPDRRVVLLLHGLDSSSSTWKHVLPRLRTNADDCSIAMDCRGCGLNREDLLDEDFSLEALVQDVHNCVLASSLTTATATNNIVLLGHSMGARIALAYAARYPERVSCLIMEDMDVGRRRPGDAPFSITRGDVPFQRSFASQTEAMHALVQAGYPHDRVHRWAAGGRIFQQADGRWWSMVNPDFRRLCYQHVVDNDWGEEQCRSVAKHSFPVHVLVGGPEHTICRAESLETMRSILSDHLFIH